MPAYGSFSRRCHVQQHQRSLLSAYLVLASITLSWESQVHSILPEQETEMSPLKDLWRRSTMLTCPRRSRIITSLRSSNY